MNVYSILHTHKIIHLMLAGLHMYVARKLKRCTASVCFPAAFPCVTNQLHVSCFSISDVACGKSSSEGLQDIMMCVSACLYIHNGVRTIVVSAEDTMHRIAALALDCSIHTQIQMLRVQETKLPTLKEGFYR